MAKDLTSSRIDRQNILNNELALQEIQDTSNIRGIVFEGKVCLTKNIWLPPFLMLKPEPLSDMSAITLMNL